MAAWSFVRGVAWVRGGGRLAFGVAGVLAATSGAAAAQPDEPFRCGLRESRGVAAADAATAAQLVCAELRRASGGRGAFDIDLATLGRLVVVTATREEPSGSVSVQVEGLEEVPAAAPRIADALARGLGFTATQRTDNLLEGETRPVRSKKGSLKFSVGIADVESPGHGARGAGFSLGLVYASSRFALPVDVRFAWDDAAYPEKEMGLFSLSVGGRGYLSTRDVSPFFGGGLGILSLSASEGEFPWPGATTEYFDGSRFGVAPYFEAGVEMLRLHRARVTFGVRADLPTGSLHSPEVPVLEWDPRAGEYEARSVAPARSRYVVPITVGVQLAF